MPGSLKVLACYLMWAFLVLYWPLFGAMDPLAVLSFRIIFSMLFCLIVMLILGQGPAILALMKDKRQMLFLLLAGITITVNWGGYIIAVMTGRVIDASLAYYMYPIFSIVLGFFIYNERLRPLQWVAFVLAVLGVTVPIIAYGQVPVFAIIIGTSFAFYGAIKKQITASGMLSIFMETLMVVPVALIYLVAFSHLEGLTPRDILLIPTMGVVTTVPLLFFCRRHERHEPIPRRRLNVHQPHHPTPPRRLHHGGRIYHHSRLDVCLRVVRRGTVSGGRIPGEEERKRNKIKQRPLRFGIKSLS